MTSHLSAFLPLALLFAASSNLLSADESTGKSDVFVRLQRDDDEQPIALETAIASLAEGKGELRGVEVDLIGAIHIADKSYYKTLNRRFRTYDAVLYELVAPADAAIPERGARSGNPVGGIQVGMKSMLDLEFQLDVIDYSRENMIHADMSPREFFQTMRRRNESLVGTFFRIMGRGIAEQAKDPFGSGDWKLVAAMFAEDRAYRMKVALAEQFADLEGQMRILDGPEGSTIVTERNKKALEVLTREVGRGKKKLAIFYGAGHLPDLERRLIDRFGMKRVRTEWLPAWSLQRDDSDSGE